MNCALWGVQQLPKGQYMTTTITVSTLNGLYSALAKATGGETILLAAGSYGKLSLGAKSGFDITFPSNVTIASADPNKPAIFSGMDIREAANLTFDGVTFDYTFAPTDKIFSRPFNVSDFGQYHHPQLDL